MLDEINRRLDSSGARWINLRTKTDPHLDGTIIDAEPREKTFDGIPIMNRKTGQPRIEHVYTLQTALKEDADDNGIRKWAANESAQRAIADAKRAAGKNLEIGGRLKIAVIVDPATERDQPTFKAKYEPPAATVDDEEPF